jgi:hypothetical protein
MNRNRKMHIFTMKTTNSSQPFRFRNGSVPPPRNSVVAIAETVTMLTYSARKNSANFSDEYSVWNPPTSSDSASGRSNGARLVSPTIAMTNTTKLGSSTMTFHRLPACDATMSAVESDPA